MMAVMKYVFSIVLFVAACGSKPPAAATTTAPAPATDDLCEVVEKAIAGASDKFATLDKTLKPSDAKTVSVDAGVGPSGPAWTVSWDTAAPTNDRLAKLKSRVVACSFAKDLVGDGAPHQTEKDGPPDAIDWKLPARNVAVEIIAEGTTGVQLVISTQ